MTPWEKRHYVIQIEFQTRGSPHVYLLIWILFELFGLEIWSDIFQDWDHLIGSTLVDLYEIQLGELLKYKAQDDQ